MYDRAIPGQRLRIPAGDWNAAMAAAEAHAASGRSGGRPISAPLPAGCVWGRNSTATDIERFTVVSTVNSPIDPATNEEAYLSSLVLNCGYIQHTEYVTPWAVAQEPIPAGKIGVVMVDGVSPIKIKNTATFGGLGKWAWINQAGSGVAPDVLFYPVGPIKVLESSVRATSDPNVSYAICRFPVEVGPILCVTTAAIASATFGNVNVADGGGAAVSPAKTLSAYNGYSVSIASGKVVLVRRFNGTWRIVQAWP